MNYLANKIWKRPALIGLLLLCCSLLLTHTVWGQTILQPPIWDKTFGGTADEGVKDIINTSDGGYLVVGSSVSGANGNKTEASRGVADFWAVKVSSAGVKEWDKRFGTTSNDVCYSAAETTDGGFLLVGMSTGDLNGDRTMANLGGSNRDYWVVKINSSGIKQWDKAYGGVSDDEASSVVATADGGAVIAGYSFSVAANATGQKTDANNGSSNADYWVLKINSTGTAEWDNALGSTSDEGGCRLTKTSDGGYIVAGWSMGGISGDITDASYGGRDIWVVKINSLGVKEWDESFGGSSGEGGSALAISQLNNTSVIQTSDGGYLIGTTSASGVSGNKTTGGSDANFWVIKITATGAKEWDQTIVSTGADDLYDIKEIPTGFLLVGNVVSNSVSSTRTAVGKYTGFVTLLSLINKTNGAFISDKVYEGKKLGSTNPSQAFMEVDAAGKLVLAVTMPHNAGQYKSANAFDATGVTDDFWVLKLDPITASLPVKTWDKTYGGTLVETPKKILKTADGGYLLAGTSASAIDGNKTDANSGTSTDVWFVKLNNAGVKEWDKSIGSTTTDTFYDVIQTADGGYIAIATTTAGASGDKTSLNYGTTDYWVFKIDATGNKLWDYSYGGTLNEYPIKILAASGGGYYIFGNTDSGISGNKTNSTLGVWIVKIDDNGIKQSEAGVIIGSDSNVNDVIPTTDGGFFILTNSQTNLEYGKTSSTLVKQWEGVLTTGVVGTIGSAAFAVQAADGGYVIVTNTTANIEGDKTSTSYGSHDVWLAKLDALGVKQFDRSYGTNVFDLVRDVQPLPNNELLILVSSTGGINTDKTTASKGAHDAWVIKLNANLFLQWEVSFGGSSQDASLNGSIVPEPNDGFTFLVNSSSPISGDKSENNFGTGTTMDYWVVKAGTSVAASANLSLASSPATSLKNTGETGTITYTLTNAGADTATNVEIRIKLPTTVSLLNATPELGTYDAIRKVWTVPSMPVGSKTITLTYQMR